MRWLLWLMLAIALVIGALYGVGRFLLPNNLEVTRTIAIERPRAAVYALMGDLRIAKEWSPYYARDPDAEYTFTGEAGEGQSMRWVSRVREIGAGRMSIIGAIENAAVESILEVKNATLNSRMEVRSADNGAAVSWTISAVCAEGWINVPCRYMNLILRGAIDGELEGGLARLKTLSEQLPPVDFENLRPVFPTIEPQTYLYSQVSTPNHDPVQVAAAVDTGLTQVRDFMRQSGLVEAGPQYRVTTEWDEAAGRMSFRVGYPFQGATPLTTVGVQVGQTPSGRVVRVMHEGERARTRETYEKIYAYLQAHRIAVRADGLPWEIIHSEGDVEGQPARVEIFVPLQ